MPRNARNSFSYGFYHVMVQGDEKKFIFEIDEDKRKYFYLLKHNAFRNDVNIISYCIMDNHAHILLFCKDVERISKMMSQTNTSYGIFYNEKRGNVGHVFRDRFRSEIIYTKSHLMNCIRYIHENPVKAGICSKCGDYHFSSFCDINKIDYEILKIANLSKEDVRSLISKWKTNEKFIDVDIEDNDHSEFQKLKDTYSTLWNKKEIANLYLVIKEKYQYTDMQIAEIFNLSRYQLFRILKEEKIK